MQLIMSGTLRPAMIANKARISNKRIVITCEFCSTLQASRRQYIKHRKDMHPAELWICKVCSRGYKSYNGCYKHEKGHEAFKIFCPVCGKGFNYKKDMEIHLPVHSDHLKVFCLDCGKGFASDRSLARHAVIHQNLQFSCSECSYVNNTKEKLQRHWCGHHGQGFTTLCGQYTYKWPGRRQKHQEECKQCGIQKQLKQNKQFPGLRNDWRVFRTWTFIVVCSQFLLCRNFAFCLRDNPVLKSIVLCVQSVCFSCTVQYRIKTLHSLSLRDNPVLNAHTLHSLSLRDNTVLNAHTCSNKTLLPNLSLFH